MSIVDCRVICRNRFAKSFSGFFVFAIFTVIALRARLAIAAPSETRLAIVVGNNGSVTLARAELRYADDDAAKYAALLGSAGREGDVELLTRMDDDTARLFPVLARSAAMPTREAVNAAVARIAARAQAARKRGEAVVFTFVFAGHGDVEDGRGFLELEDGRFFREDLEALLQRIPATRAHVVLDACNSVYMLASRKPGGTRFATPEDIERSMRARLAHVGTFLSTSADAQVYEWSQIESGVFSHAVRSGLAGAADLDGDGRITYGELRAFVRVAAAGVPNPRFRPRIYARGPEGRDDEVLFDTRAMKTSHTLTLDATSERRVTVLDANEVPLVDVRLESGFGPSLRLPASEGRTFTLVERESGRPERRTAIVPSEADGTMLAQAESPSKSARAGARPFELLFALGFGPRAVAALPPEKPENEVYGVSIDDRERMGRLLNAAAQMQRDRRIQIGLALGAAGTIVAGSGAAFYFAPESSNHSDEAGRITGAILMGAGGAAIVGSILKLTSTSELEDRYAAYKAATSSKPETYDAAVRDAEKELFARAAAERRGRTVGGVALIATGALVLGTGTVLQFVAPQNERPDAEFDRRFIGQQLIAYGAGITLSGIGLFFIRSEEERLAELWKGERAPAATKTSSFRLQPLIGAGSLGLGGTF